MGIAASGRWWMPPQVEALPRHLRAHTADPIDFAALRGKCVAVLGAGASAFDNAATALEDTTRQYVERLEAMVDEERLPAGDDLISEIEQFLRDRGSEGRERT